MTTKTWDTAVSDIQWSILPAILYEMPLQIEVLSISYNTIHSNYRKEGKPMGAVKKLAST